MLNLKTISPLLLTSLLSGCIVVANSSHAKYHGERQLSLSAEQIQHLSIDAGAGDLIVIGSQSLKSIEVNAEIYSENGGDESIELTLDSSGDSAYLVAKANHSSGNWMGSSPRINVTVNVPQSLLLTIDDGSGDIDISKISANVKVSDGSGGMSISNIAGNLIINDGSGEIVVNNVSGDVSVADNSGQVEITQVTGNVDIEDGSGQIHVSHVSGDTFIDDGSGDLFVGNVEGVVKIDDGSGDIEVKNCGGLEIVNAGSGGVYTDYGRHNNTNNTGQLQ